VEYDYSKRGYLLPDGCKDLIDVIQPKMHIREGDFYIVTIQLPGLENADVKIFVEGNTIRIIAKQAGGHAQYEREIEVPGNFATAKARAIYIDGQLCITVPKARKDFPPSFQAE
jgi:HSP20 family molecular chaperone IbpA